MSYREDLDDVFIDVSLLSAEEDIINYWGIYRINEIL